MAIVLSWILTPLFLLALTGTLVIWQPVIVISGVFGIEVQRRVVEAGNFLLVSYLRIMGGSLSVSWPKEAPAKGPVIVVSNHQSYFDIPIFIWIFRRYHAVFVAKKSLGRGLPSISYVLRNHGSALINRKSARQALPAIKALGTYIIDNHCAACIFPEGTRARDGNLKTFKPHGLAALLKAAPGVPVLPVAMDGTWRLMRYNLLPVPLFPKVHVEIFPPLDRAVNSDEEIISRCEDTLRAYFSGASDLTVQGKTAKK